MEYITPDIKKIKITEDYYIYIEFINNQKKVYNIKKLLENSFFEKLKDKEYLKKAKIRKDTIEWPNGEDIAPESLYYDSIPIKEFNGIIKEL